MTGTYIGIDLGTSSVKLLLVGEDGAILRRVTREYPIYYPRSGWSEQRPEDWYDAAMDGMEALLSGEDRGRVRGIGIGGQMHGLVALDGAGEVIRPAILWNDGRTEKETAWLNDSVGRERLSSLTANIAFAGFTAPKILWLRENEPENFARIEKIMLPKDYVVLRLCGAFSTDFSDASGTLLLDVRNRRWSDEMCALCGVEREWLPEPHESYEPVGTLKRDAAERLGLRSDVVVCAGAGDNAAAAVGTGTVRDGDCNISVGTSGTVFISRDAFSVDKANALHSFAHANGRYHLMGCILSAAACNDWWMKGVLNTDDFDAEQKGLEDLMGRNDVYFLPYLMGERSPHNDVNARGAFVGMRPDTSRGQMTLAVLEGVAYALCDCVDVAREEGLDVRRTRLCGGGARSALWSGIIANVLDVPVELTEIEEGPSYGAAILAMTACGAYPTVEEAAASLVRVRKTVLPDGRVSSGYAERHRTFKALYPALKDVYGKMGGA